MTECPNCSTKFTCGCQKRTASDGKPVCSNCLALYEKQIKEAMQQINNDE